MDFWKFINDIFNVSIKADRIRSDEETRRKSVHFAVTASVFALVSLALAIGGGFILKIAGDSALIIFLIVIGVAFLVGALVNYASSLVRVIAQFRINKRPASYVALVVLILCFIGGVVGVFLLLG